jgi:hypothetical protein
MNVVSTVAWGAFDLWAWPMIALSWTWSRTRGTFLHRCVKWLCPPALPAWVIGVATSGHMSWWLWLFAAADPIAWLVAHRMYCKDDHSRRLRDAANGLVRRVGNRLTVQPAPDGVAS